MYTRSRQSQNFTGGTPQRNQQAAAASAGAGAGAGAGAVGNQQQYQGQQQAAGVNQNQQAAFKQQQQGNNIPYKQQPQQQQQQGTQQQQRNAQQQAKPQPTSQQLQQLKQQQQAAQQQSPQPQRLKPILKSSTNVQGNQVQVQGQGQPQTQQAQSQQNQAYNQSIGQGQQANNGMDTTEPAHDGLESDIQDGPKWRRKTPGLKVNRKLKRLRMNQRLRKTLQPKNAIMVLNEMKTGVQFTFPETQSTMPNSLFLVHAEIEGKTYIGQGVSKPLARQNAAENALKTLLLEKMTAAAMKARLDAEVEGASTGDASENKDGESMETNSEESDEIPWSSLASFALYKLFLEWQNQGTVVPVPRPGISPGKIKKEAGASVPKPTVQKELPPNAITIHPVMLLNQMRPGLTYTEVSRVGNPPNTIFTLGIEVDGQEYTGSAKNKKDAKKLTAKAALHALFNLVYPEDKDGEDVNMG